MGISNPDGLIQAGGTTETKLNSQNFESYTSSEAENNSNSSTSEDGLRGKHVYYNEQTHGVNNQLEFKGKWRGVVMLKKTSPFTQAEISDRMTPGA
jgi:hypothetical protein